MVAGRIFAFALLLATARAATLGDPPVHLAEARALLDAGQAPEALAKAEQGLEFAPDDLDLLDLASRAAQAAGSTDFALWYGALALDEAQARAARALPPARPAGSKVSTDPKPPPDAEPSPAAVCEAISKRLAAIDPLGRQEEALLRSYSSAILAAGKDCAARKLFVNAVDLLAQCRTGGDAAISAAAEVELAKIYENKKAVEALLDSGLDVPLKVKRKRSPEALAKEDQKHATWASAWEVKGPQYTIKTDMGRETAEAMSLAMERMNRHYRRVFHVKEHGGGETARVTICVYKNRAEFDEHEGGEEPISESVAGFFKPLANYVATYDPREHGRPLASLWETLFHEASHQFTHLISADLIPSWLNEGTASYFEGARLLSNGTVETNLVPEERLAGLVAYLNQGSPTLKEVVSWFQPGSYPGEYYAFGWGLVYFLQNYADPKSQRVYRKPYEDFVAAYGKGGGKHDVFGRFVEHFVTRPKQPGVATFEQFEARWRAWILELSELYFGPPEAALKLVARGLKERADKQPAAAEESFRWALRKRPDDPVAAFELGELLAAQKQADAAIHGYRRALASLRLLADPGATLPGSGDLTAADLSDVAAKGILRFDKALGEALSAADRGFAASAAGAARGYADKDLPIAALRLLDRSLAVHGRSPELSDLRDEIALDSGVDTRRWRRLPLPPDLAGWDTGGGFQVEGPSLIGESDDPSFCMRDDSLPARFRFEARVDASGLEPGVGFMGLVFGANSEGLQYLGFSRDGLVELGTLEEGWKPLAPLTRLKPDRMKSLGVAIEVHADRVEIFLDGKPMGSPRAYAPEALAGSIGFVVQGGRGRFSDARVRS